VQTYYQAMQRFRKQMLVLKHITAGQPAQGTELVTAPYINIPNSKSRGTLVEDSLIVDITLYHKGIRHSSKAKAIHQYLPREVGKLFFYYL
jgi:hypothetical protein